jgi:hypothetical protein
MTSRSKSDVVRRDYASLAAKSLLLSKYQSGASLTKAETEALWIIVSDIVYSRARGHFGKTQRYGKYIPDERRDLLNTDPDHPGYERHISRILSFLEYARENADKSPGWVVVSYRLNFPSLEAVIQLREMGIITNWRKVGAFVKHQKLFHEAQRRGINTDNVEDLLDLSFVLFPVKNPSNKRIRDNRRNAIVDHIQLWSFRYHYPLEPVEDD